LLSGGGRRDGRCAGDLLRYYFYLWDEDFGPAFIKVCTYFPYPIKVCVNGHEWAKRQAVKAGIGFTALPNGFASCDDPTTLQAICDRLGPGTIEVFSNAGCPVRPPRLRACPRERGRRLAVDYHPHRQQPSNPGRLDGTRQRC
jgi:hypothetical protein